MGGTCAGVPEVLSWDQTLNEEREDVCELPALHDCSTKALVQKCLAAGGEMIVKRDAKKWSSRGIYPEGIRHPTS